MGTPEMHSFGEDDEVYQVDSLTKLRDDLRQDIELIEEQLNDPTVSPEQIKDLKAEKAELMEQYKATDPNNNNLKKVA